MNTKQVAGWMLELGEWFEGIATTSTMTCTNELNHKRAEIWRERAAKVEAMTCNGCRWWLSPVGGSVGGVCRHEDNAVQVLYPEPKFGCIHWEEKK